MNAVIATRPGTAARPAAGGPLAFEHLLLLVGGIALAIAPHLGRLPLWIAAMAVLLLSWRVWAAWRGATLPRRWLLVPLTLAIIAGVYLSHRTLFGRDAGVALLVVLLALKLLEMRALRDVVVTTVLAYFLALSAFFYSQQPSVALLSLCTVIALTTALVAINAPHLSLRKHLKTAGMLLAQGVPLMVILFFLFPRVQGPLWGLPSDAYSGRTGLSDSMSPGAISMLAHSDEIAFRVKFDGEPPPREQLYWRGPVFWAYDGRTWYAGNAPREDAYRFEPLGEPVRYTVTLEPHSRHWLFGLEMPATLPPNAYATADYQLLSRTPVHTRLRYSLTSYPAFRAIGGPGLQGLPAALALPEGYNPRARALAAEWRRAAASDAEVVQRAITHFRTGGYQYTLYPPLAGEHAVDEFLFDSRAGFCEHYAGAFVFLMRAAGVPARVVTGYQGGEVNPVDGYLTVRQADAHAWAEVWLPELGWLRVDPTAAAVPVRATGGLSAAVPAVERPQALIRLDSPWLRALRHNLEALSNYWNQWVLGYDVVRQRELFMRFGMPAPAWQDVAMTLFWIFSLAVLLLSLWLLRRARRADPVQQAWSKFCRKLRKRGVFRRPSEGPVAFAARAALARPQQAQAIVAIARLYAELRYGPHADRRGVKHLARMVQRFRP